MYQYNEAFYRYINQGACYAAGQLLPALCARLAMPVKSVLDVGCGAGAWLSVWKQHGAQVLGLDGAYVLPQSLLIESDEFKTQDLSHAFDLGRRFDLVQCLEVAEHIPSGSSEDLVQSLCRHTDMVLFSAAPPGQGGENHVNEQPYDYWRDLFAAQGFCMYDPVRAELAPNTQIKPWYRFNTFLYVRTGAVPTTHASLADSRVPEGVSPRDIGPLLYRLRKRLVAALPVASMTALATLKKRVFNVGLGQ